MIFSSLEASDTIYKPQEALVGGCWYRCFSIFWFCRSKRPQEGMIVLIVEATSLATPSANEMITALGGLF